MTSEREGGLASISLTSSGEIILQAKEKINQWAHMSIRSDGMLNRSASVRDLISKDKPQLANEIFDKHFYKVMSRFYKDYFK